MKKLGCRMAALLLAVCLLPACVQVLAVGEDELTETNITLYHPTTASSAGDKALLAVDGINKNSSYTYWEAEAGDTELWWQVDLEKAHSINRFELEMRKGSEHTCKNFEIRASNDESFAEYTVLASQGNSVPEGGVFSEKAATSKSFRYLRIVKTKQEAFTIGEFRAWILKDKIRYGTQTQEGNTQIPDWEGNGSYQVPADVTGTDLEQAVKLLGVLNIMRGYPDGNFLPDEAITRAEFVTSAVKMAGLTPEYFAGTQTYSDVSPEHWAFNAIETATAIGLVGGMGDGSFLPDARITMAQAVRVVVTLLGYDAIAAKRGGWSQGYVTVAAELKLLGGIYSAADEAITRGEIASLVYNALHTEVMTTGIGVVPALTQEDYTLMNATLGLYKSTGLVTATNLTGLTEVTDKASAGYIKINDIMMECSVPNYFEYIGIPVVYYYKDTNEPEVVFLQAKKNVKIIDIAAEDVARFDNDGELEYFVNENYDTEEIDISDTADVIYNGKAAKGYDISNLPAENGTLRLVDVNGDGQVELIMITAVRTHIVKYVNEANELIAFDDSATPLSYNKSKDSIEIYFAGTGAAMALSDIKAGDVISVMESRNTTGAKMLQLYISRDSVQGTVKEKTETDILIGNKRYKLADCISLDEITIGIQGNFFLDMNGRVAAFAGKDADGEYAYLVAVAEKGGIDRTLRVKLFTKKGTFEEMDCSDKLSVDGKSMASLTALNNHLLD
ncbi:MAG: S-layer homology domain-containing protein, partial [Clostridia bacterium]|nr:S-layer homology domain-containing protein [Clostridia bacterium]